jgi:hypothetical protein
MINELAARYGIHRTTVTALLDQHQIPRHSARTNWSDDELRNAAEQYGSGCRSRRSRPVVWWK